MLKHRRIRGKGFENKRIKEWQKERKKVKL
jgi:hypothetical protein